MITINSKSDCCGCGACEQRCSQHCISLVSDNEGFVYPVIDKELCVNCGLCERVCPVINQNERREPLNVFAAKNRNDEIRMKSSSGGVFSLLAEQIINEGGVVFGARFNEQWDVVHSYTETIDGNEPFRGSKYVQSYIGDSFIKAESFLKQGRKVLFMGTPCQIAGLHKFLRKAYDNLLTMDVVCHGVPSPLVWKEYLKSIGGGENPLDVSFRDKSTGWKNYSTKYLFEGKILHQLASQDLYMKGFLKDLYLRPSCYDCPSKAGKSDSDITLGDFWGVQNYHPEIDDDKGVGVALLWTDKGKEFFEHIDADCTISNYAECIKDNPSLVSSTKKSKLNDEFWTTFHAKGAEAISLTCKKLRPSIFQRIFDR
jgi:coenzyme F420-reducing hydrogenase beta subunit